ncbi:MAG: phosphoenolpyruvate carboxykinase (GTP) [Candidatus Micrarchaeia archaeon]
MVEYGLENVPIENSALLLWVREVAKIANPEMIVWCNGSKEEYDALIKKMLSDGTMIALNQKEYPNCYLNRSDKNDVARTEARTFIACKEQSNAGPLNNWLPPEDAVAIYNKLLPRCMKGRTMYVVPYVMGPIDSPYSEIGVELTDSAYVVANMKIMTHMGSAALAKLGGSSNFVRGIHATMDMNPDEKYIIHFTDSEKPSGMPDILSVNTNYGGNALLGKKCHALRIASVHAKSEGWLAEHMLILELENPDRKLFYIAAAFPSSSGKTNLANILPPEQYEKMGWKSRVVGDDIAWLHVKNGVLNAINPETGFFGVAPGTSMKTNPNVMKAIRRNTIFTNVGLTEDGMPYWEGMGPKPSVVYDWQGNICSEGMQCAHPNSRYTTPIVQAENLSLHWQDKYGVNVSAIVFGGRRSDTIPLVYQTFSWSHGVFAGATMGVEQTAAAEGSIGAVRRDPMAMRPFCGYNIADYFSHWLEIGKSIASPPPIFYVNWFMKGSDGRFLFPGFGENMRVLEWIVKRIDGTANARITPIGYMPGVEDINWDGIEIPESAKEKLLGVDKTLWLKEIASMESFFDGIGNIPAELRKELEEEKKRLEAL